MTPVTAVQAPSYGQDVQRCLPRSDWERRTTLLPPHHLAVVRRVHGLLRSLSPRLCWSCSAHLQSSTCGAPFPGVLALSRHPSPTPWAPALSTPLPILPVGPTGHGTLAILRRFPWNGPR